MPKLTAILIVMKLMLLANPSASQSFKWARQFGGSVGENRSVATDDLGNVYIAGYFSGTVDFDPGPGTFNLTSNSLSYDIFIAKLDGSGNFGWSKQIGGPSDDMAYSIALDDLGNIYTTGVFSESVDFDPGNGTFNQTTFSGAKDVFVHKLNTDGNFVWAKQFPGISWNTGYAITVDASGNVYTAGHFYLTADFDPGVNSYTLTETGTGGDVFVSKLDASGNFLWARKMGGPGSIPDAAFAIAVDEAGSVFTTGLFENTADFDPGAGVFNLTSTGNDVFVSKLDVDGNFVWAKQLGGASYEVGSAIVISATGDIFVAGYFRGTADFDPGPAALNLTSAGEEDIFIVRLNGSGDLVWARQQGGINPDFVFDMALDHSNNLYTTGLFFGTSDFDPGSGTINLSAVGSADLYVSKLDASGNLIWARQIGGMQGEKGYSIDVNTGGEIDVVGTFDGTMDFNPGTGTFSLVPAGTLDMFVLRFTLCTNTGSTHTVSACNSYRWINGTTYNSSNNSDTFSLISKTGCDSLVTLNLTIKKVDKSLTITTGSITANAIGGTYQWFNCDNGQDINLANSQSFLPIANGNYGVKILQNGCHGISDCTPMIINDVTEAMEGSVQVYPNPTGGLITLTFPDHFKGSKLSVLNMLGQPLAQREITEPGSIDMRIEGGAGLYLLAIATSDGETTLIRILKK